MVTIIIRNDRFRIFMTDNINEQPIEFVSNSESKYVMGFTSRNSRRVRIWKTGRNIPYPVTYPSFRFFRCGSTVRYLAHSCFGKLQRFRHVLCLQSTIS
jgi:hypothetical protein